MAKEAKKFLIGITICISLFLVIFPISVLAESLTVVTEEWKPYNYREDGTLIGLAAEVVQATLAAAGIDEPISVYPWPRAYSIAKHQKNSLIFSIARTPEREQNFHWIGPIAPPLRAGFIKLQKRADIALSSIDAAKRYVVGVPRGVASHEYLLRHGFEEGENLIVVGADPDNVALLLSLLLLERIDLVAGSEHSYALARYAMGETVDKLEMAYVYLEKPIFMALNKTTSADTVHRLSTAFKKVQESGLMERLEEKYVTEAPGLAQ